MTNKAASALARRKWKAIPKAERSEAARKAVLARWARLTPEERKAEVERNLRGKS